MSRNEWIAQTFSNNISGRGIEARQREQQYQAMTRLRFFPDDPTRIVVSFSCAGLRCLILNGPMSLNGYVHIPASHPANGRWYDDVEVEVHGGLTFMCRDLDGGTWFGFDTAHAGDMIILPDGVMDGRRWDVADVRAETERLARQLAAMTAQHHA